MMQSKAKMKYFRPAPVGVCLLVLLILASVTALAADEGSPVLTAEREGDRAFLVLCSADIGTLTDGEAMALLLTVEVTEGYRITGVEACRGAEGLRLTAGETGGEQITLLLDGYPQKTPSKTGEKGAKIPLFRVFFEAFDAVRGAELRVFSPYGEGVYLYLTDGEGQVKTVPLPFVSEEKTREEGTETDAGTDEIIQSPVQKPAVPSDTGEESTEESVWETEVEAVTDPGSPPYKAFFLGCRETPVGEGEYAVQFIFSGAGQGTPVVCAEGGGMLTLDMTVGEHSLGDLAKAWRICTFSGLRTRVRYRFFIYMKGKTVTAEYENGVFLGYSTEGSYDVME